MMDGSAIAQAIRWQTRPLCRRYHLLRLEALAVPVCEEGFGRDQSLRWGVGMLADGQCEVLGAWLEPALAVIDWAKAFEALKVRGVEKIQFILSNQAEAVPAEVSAAYSSTKVLPPTNRLLRQRLVQFAPRDSGLGCPAIDAKRVAGTAQLARTAMTDLSASPLGVTQPAVLDRWRETVQDLGPFYDLGPRLQGLIRSADETAQRVSEALRRAVARKGCFPSSTAAVTFVSDVLDRIDRGFGSGDSLAGSGVRRHVGCERQSSPPARHH